jgi:hypothetical protein
LRIKGKQRGYGRMACIKGKQRSYQRSGEWPSSAKTAAGKRVANGERRKSGRGGGAIRNGTRAASPQHSRWSLALYLPFVYYYLVGTSFETGTWEASAQRSQKPHT